jgi:hypothetical protein
MTAFALWIYDNWLAVAAVGALGVPVGLLGVYGPERRKVDTDV